MQHSPTLLTTDQAINAIKAGEVIAYPTETVYGLGCNPSDEHAVNKILALKKRSEAKGLILITNSWENTQDFIAPLNNTDKAKLNTPKAHPCTWLLPINQSAPKWVIGSHDKIAIRQTNHPIVSTLCEALGHPLVSTSANLSGHPTCDNAQSILDLFGEQIAGVVEGACGPFNCPSEVCDLHTGEIIRPWQG